MTTSRRFAISILIGTLALASQALPGAPRPAASSPAGSRIGSPDTPQVNPQGKPPSDEEIRTRSEKLLANQHNNDEAIEQYERVEHHVDRTSGSTPRTLEDKVYRIVPTGAGTMKIVLRDGGKATSPDAYDQQLHSLADILRTMANPNDPRARAAYAKREKRMRDRAEFVQATEDAFIPKWAGTATWNGRACDVLDLNPNPNFHPHSMFQDALQHVTARIWVDRETNQMARGEAHVMSDISFGGGILGKLYRGGVVSMEQAEVAPGIWLPTRYQYDFSGRRFFFAFEQHQLIEASHYSRVGPPKEALLLVQSELSSGKTFLADP